MRKKLLALLMCATMVLGSSAVAFAAPTSKELQTAQKVFTENGASIVDEYDTNDDADSKKEVVKVSGVKVNSVEGTYGFDLSYNPVKLNDSDKPLKYIGTNVVGVNTKKGDAPVDVSIDPSTLKNVTNPSVAAQDALDAFIASKGSDAYIADDTKLAQLVKTGDNSYAVWVYSLADSTSVSTGIATTALKADGSLSTADIAISGVETFSVTPSVDTTTGLLKADVDFMTKDGYSYETSSTKLVKMDPRVSAADGSENYYYVISEAYAGDEDSELTRSVAMAIKNGTLTSNAAGIQINVYQATASSSGAQLVRVSRPASELTITLDCDILSNTKLAKETTTLYTISGNYVNDTSMKAYRSVVKVGTNENVDFSKAYGTFDISLSTLLGNTGNYAYLIFDQGADASQNDGVSDTDTTPTSGATSETAATSPKTGDVAPIAALAVVMMGACGAMVVASKKRA